MQKTEEGTHRRHIRTERIMYAVFAYMIFMFLISFIYKGNKLIKDADIIWKIGLTGQVSTDGGASFTQYSGHNVTGLSKATQLIFEGNFDTDIPEGMQVWLYMGDASCRIWINGECVYSKADANVVWDDFISEGITSDDEIKILLGCNNTYPVNMVFARTLEHIHAGSRFDISKQVLMGNLFYIIIAAVIMVMGIAMIPYGLQLRRGEDRDNYRVMFASAMLLMAGAVSCLFDYTYMGLLADNLYFLKYVAILSPMLVGFFMLRYLGMHMSRPAFKRISRLMCYASIALISLFMILVMLSGSDELAELMLRFYNYMGFAMLTAETAFVILDIRKWAREDVPIMAAALLAACGFLGEMVYFALTGVYFMRVFIVCLFIFTLTEWGTVTFKNIQNSELARRTRELESELTQNQVQMMISQIQPHFLYNALGTIRALCVKDPQTARDAIDSFSKYLRANMDSLNQKGCIPFAKELEHTKCYLYIEQLRFGDLLEVEYDIETTDFEIPALVLQTMSENAVKHGLLAKREGGKLKISTREGSSCYEIRIEDDGVGFDTTKPLDDSRSHVGVANSKQRIAGMCGGSLVIGSKPGQGTTITIIIPKKAEEI